MDLAHRTPEEEVAALRHELAAMRAQLGTAAAEIEHLRAQLGVLRRQHYGQSSERRDADITQLELRLEDLEENEAARQAAIPTPATLTGPAKPRQKAVRRPLPDHLPRETVMHEPEVVCGCCGRDKLARLGEDVTEVLEKVPARLKVIRHVRPRYACRVCEGTTVMTQPVLYTDDTPIRTLAPGTGKTRLSRFWVYAVDPRPHAGPGAPAAFYCYSPDRKGERPRCHLAGFSGVMHADAFAGYDALYRPEPGKPARIQHAACWAHTIRTQSRFDRWRRPWSWRGVAQRDDMLDLQVVVMDGDALDHQLQDRLAVGDAGALQPCADAFAERGQAVQHVLGMDLLLGRELCPNLGDDGLSSPPK